MLDTPSAVAVAPVPASVAPPSFSERILDAAATILGDGAKGDYTVNTIMKVANVGVSTLYSRFPGKKDMVTEALMQREMWIILDYASRDGGPYRCRTEVRRVVEAMVWRAFDRPTMTQMLNLEWSRIRLRKPHTLDHVATRVQYCLAWRTDPERERAKRVASEVVALVRSVIDTACADGERDATALSDRLMGAVVHHLHDFKLWQDPRTGS